MARAIGIAPWRRKPNATPSGIIETRAEVAKALEADIVTRNGPLGGSGK
ncbi:MAG: hypothetical protein QNJ30_21010 [Kiloniellales bacterium]|nr:hypothetical protein [Kiloniellales bacterium]